METLYRYNKLNEFFKNKFGERVLKICVDGGFTCPNRDGTVGTNGCIFCSQRGSGEHLNSLSIDLQISNFFKSDRSKRANKFIVYFQNFTNTYDTIENLKKKYDLALNDSRIVGLAVATRPDCISEDVAKLLKSYSEKYYVFVELGLQTSNDYIAKTINRGYPSSCFSTAVDILNKYGIDIVTHIMVGLPNETFEDIENTVTFINKHNIQGLKIHSTYVIENTYLAKLYKENLYTPITLEYYLDSLKYILTHVNPNLIIHKISGDAPKNLLLAPEWNLHKKWVLNGIDKILKNENLHQGIFFD